MKRAIILFIIFGIWFHLAFDEAAYSADSLLSAAGIYTFEDKPIAPDFTIEDVQGKQVQLKDFRGKVVLLFFWTTW